MANIDDLTVEELMELCGDDSFNEEVTAMILCGYSFDNAMQTAIERRLEK